MASFLVRNALNITRRGLFTSSVRSAIPEEFPDTMKVITGLEKKEIEANMAGKDERFDVQTFKRPEETSVESPIAIRSAYTSRVIGCICSDESTAIQWMWLKRGAPQQCACGHYFQLTSAANRS
ncbi:cytochrome c oxidase subunit 5B, mitochondrial isoform X2 [Nilaparvata lugens]|uniref:cytochrome c oxidase subunit 5B, mitochondrial isoform X2 n=1 Tax=Nilaparvata lugens TaxID=108931 RepID=UPI000B981188|nr:cytochrome c oxidase subunit 5B, mitochondrial isoform X2 [Nilaparvata lugens]